MLEVNGLGEFGCKVEPIYSGRKVTAVRLSWWAKNLDERKSTLNELSFSRVGRRARLQGKVETLAPLEMPSPPIPTCDRCAPPSQNVTVRLVRRSQRMSVLEGKGRGPPFPGSVRLRAAAAG